MKLEKLKLSLIIDENSKLERVYEKMCLLLNAIEVKEIPSEIIISINSDIRILNKFEESEFKLIKKINKTYRKILKGLEKKLNIVPKNHYRNLWMTIGISIFGIVFESAYSNAGIGISIGFVLGIAVGTNLDKKAAQEGKQLDLGCVSY